ncbi:PIR protein CIR protein [Plasmodium vinckei lentum]|uniref:PIR protein CIR protein n=1 Tax=Plasmodium vinckei lentum TaxID=138297 RepID=A0A6V7S4P1_PLAVN|nr:PIR protein CIR protein [Plasmodium vinckei lentum]
MEAKELCENFIAADKIINGEYYDTMTMENKTKYPNFNKSCPNNKCKTDMQLNGLSEDLFDQLGTEIEDEYYEYFTMWLSDKLFKIANDENNPQINDITLNEAYDKYLKNNIQNGNYWSLLDIKEGLKEVNLMHMKHFYKLLNNICNAIVYYNSNEDDIKKFISNSTDCSDQYSSLYNSVPKCNSYLHLLDNLKKTYEGFKNSVHEEIKKTYPHLEGRLQTLTIENNNSYFVGKLKEFDFNSSDCKTQKAKEPGSPKKEEQPPGSQSASQKSGTSPQSGTNDSDKGQGASKSEKTDSGTQKGNSDSEGGGKGGTNNLSGNTGGGSGSGTGDTSGGQSDQGGSSGGSDSQGGSSNQGGSDDGSKGLGDQVPFHSSGASNGHLSSNWGMNFNLTSYMPNFSGIYQSSKDILTSATNKVSNAYNSAMTIAQDTYDKTVTTVKDTYNRAVSTVKDTYTRSTNYISGAVNSITIQFNPFGTSQLGDNRSGSNSSGGGVDTSNQSQPNPKQPVNSSPPPSPSPSQTSLDPSDPPSTPQLSQTPSSSQPQDPSQVPLDPSSPKSLDSQPIPTHDSKSPIQQIASTDGNRPSQISLSAQGTLPSSSTDPSTQGNGSTTGIVVKMSKTSSIWCIGSNNKCDIMGISIIVISISIILTIIYKYLSLGYTRKSKRKKSMKKVINSIGGKRPIQIIIKSYDRNKDLKPVINSVGRKKDPLLNIYKLMQADPVPFINVFFLLTFFVYKRQLNYLEL